MTKKTEVTGLVRKGAVSLVSLGLIGLASSSALAENIPVNTNQKVAPQAVRSIRTVTLNQNSVGALTNNLFSSPAERQKFMSNPKGYTEVFLGGQLDQASLQRLNDIQQRVATGFCCAGCGCGQPVRPVQNTNPAVTR